MTTLMNRYLNPAVRAAFLPLASVAITLAGALFVLFMDTAPAAARAKQPAPACATLLMDFECRQYQQRLERATNNVERDRIRLEYQQLVEERRQLCGSCRNQSPMEAAGTLVGSDPLLK
jgi:hypothetical protein